jgi:glycerophosphoryl diester phosphodiesterase
VQILQVWFFSGLLALVAADESATFREFFAPLDPPRPIGVIAVAEPKPAWPPNSLEAIRIAIEDYQEWIQIDVRQAKDGLLVVSDGEIRLPDGQTRRVRELSGADLQQILIGSPFGDRLPGERVPALREALEMAKGKINLVLACSEVDRDRLIEELERTAMRRQVLIAGDGQLVSAMAKAGFAVLTEPTGFERLSGSQAPVVIRLSAEEATPDRVADLHGKNARVLVDSNAKVNPWDNLAATNVDFVRTDRAREMIAHIALKDRSRPFRYSIHRGALRYCPENTLPAVEETIRLGADFVELDIRTSSDGRFYILHDASVDRTTNGTGPFATMDTPAIARLDAGGKFAAAYRGTPVPTFDECLDVANGKIDIYIDAKNITPEALAAIMRKYYLVEGSVVYQSPAYLAKLKELVPSVKTLPPLVASGAIDAMARGLKPYGVDVPWRLVSKELIDRCHAHGIQVFCDVPDEVTPEQCLGSGLDVIQTDRPMTILRAYEIHAARSGK